ncbi:GNAT family N-acetyltransferase [Streptomyces gibsoniae]|uniref:GNAT family N-acetyltransferase n=1 Tax=Streptomyces gibsoniae TaxID=3075529 RepID=A0ABU2U8Z1_9ACTN|nr:GNAT family N-acetyltransferase [Streptomyces sp. DSM 41699]MDT0469620.1 GNAT family N-acetyltransferase [Streptomyces sp. DSM 41699]
MSILVRPAERRDLPALVRLRVTNAERHIQLAPDIYRIPDTEAVHRHFEEVLADGSKVLISVAEVEGEVVGMAEVVLLAEPADHQILVSRRGAEIHTVVLDGHRGRGVGAALVAAAERAAAVRGVSIIYAGIFAPNKDAVGFYSASGFGPRGILLSKEQEVPGAG